MKGIQKVENYAAEKIQMSPVEKEEQKNSWGGKNLLVK